MRSPPTSLANEPRLGMEETTFTAAAAGRGRSNANAASRARRFMAPPWTLEDAGASERVRAVRTDRDFDLQKAGHGIGRLHGRQNHTWDGGSGRGVLRLEVPPHAGEFAHLECDARRGAERLAERARRRDAEDVAAQAD